MPLPATADESAVAAAAAVARVAAVTPCAGSAGGTAFGIEIDRDDDLAADHFAWAVVPSARPLRIGLFRDQNFAIDAAFRGQPIVQTVERLTTARYAEFAATGQTDDYDVIVIDGVEVETLGGGRYLMFTNEIPIDGFETSGEPENDIAVFSENDHPVNADIS